jgi:hypothetical protein
VGNGIAVSDDALTQSIIKLRKALGDTTREPAYIQTIPKRGYRLIARCCRRASASPDLGDQLVAAHHLSGMPGEREQDLDRLGLEPFDRGAARQQVVRGLDQPIAHAEPVHAADLRGSAPRHHGEPRWSSPSPRRAGAAAAVRAVVGADHARLPEPGQSAGSRVARRARVRPLPAGGPLAAVDLDQSAWSAAA